MKFLQRDFARAEGLSLIAWAFDPLQAGNAAFNLQRLGATARRYVDNMYGERTDALNNGVATDRLIAEWDLDDQREEQPPFDPDVASNLPAWLGSIVCAGGRRTPRAVAHTEHPHRALLEIPPNIAELRKVQPEVAEEWRRAVREAFHTAFVTGYRAIGFLREASSGEHQCHYLLERDSGGNVDPV
jgi:predicted GNAT superfamily acetyltransferase